MTEVNYVGTKIVEGDTGHAYIRTQGHRRHRRYQGCMDIVDIIVR